MVTEVRRENESFLRCFNFNFVKGNKTFIERYVIK